MEKFVLVEPSLNQKELAKDYINEFGNQFANGSGGLYKYLKSGKSYEEWLEKLKIDKNREVTEEHVPSLTYFLMNKSKTHIFGMINIRLALNKKLRESNGNIGYSIRPSQRGNGYNKINLYLALKVCAKYNIEKVMIDCDVVNEASKRTIIALGGVKEKEMYNEDFKCMVDTFWIDVNDSLKTNSKIYEQYID